MGSMIIWNTYGLGGKDKKKDVREILLESLMRWKWNWKILMNILLIWLGIDILEIGIQCLP